VRNRARGVERGAARGGAHAAERTRRSARGACAAVRRCAGDAYDAGVLGLLEDVFRGVSEQCVMPKGSDELLLTTLVDLHSSHRSFNPPQATALDVARGEQGVANSSPMRKRSRAARREPGSAQRQRVESIRTASFVVGRFAHITSLSVQYSS
jgi:hypothetical protein